MEYAVLNDVIPYNTVDSLYKELLGTIDWRLQGWTGDLREPLRHWAAYPDYDDKSHLGRLWEEVRDAVAADTGIHLVKHRTILNLYSFGDNSWIHPDSAAGNEYTVVGFLNPHWDLNWGGDFALVKDGEILQAFAPKPGKFVIFKSSMLHGARPVSREAPVPRFGVAFQCGVKNENLNLKGLAQAGVSSVRSTL